MNDLISDELTRKDIKTVLDRLGIEPKGRTDSGGWTTMKSPLRDERKPSFGINLHTGAWRDHGTDDSGDLVTLTERVLKKDTKEAINWIKEQADLTGQLYRPRQNGHSGKEKSKQEEPKRFWTDNRIDLLSNGQKRLQKNPDHDVIRQANNYDCLTLETLQFFGVGLIEKWGKDWLAFPYETGCQLYRRDDEKVIRNLKGSKPALSFYGSRKTVGDREALLIAKSPRETMLLWQIFGDEADVIGLATGEQGKLSNRQIEWLKSQISEAMYGEVYTLLDCDSEAAYITAESFAEEINKIAEEPETKLVNIHQVTGGVYKDITDCIRDNIDGDSLKALFTGGQMIEDKGKKATPATGNILDNQLDIDTAPTIPDEVYRNLPELLKTRCNLIEEQHRRDVFLISALPALSSQMPNVVAEHRDCYYTPDVFVQIVAAPGTGKGDATKGKGLAQITDQKIRDAAIREIQEFENRPDEEKASLQKPKKRSLYIPANASSRKMLDRLEANGGNGFIFENEIDTLINATKQDWGDYTDTVRKSFHHESLSIIRTDSEYYIQYPRLSVCLTGTFDQFKAMFESAENGHFSRYALYTFDAPREWQSHRPTKKSRGLRESIETASQQLYELYQRLNKREDPLYIELTPEQWDAIDNTFAEKMRMIETLDLSSYLHASNNRAGVIALRLASIFTVLRANEDDPNRLVLEESLTPIKADMKAALSMADMFIDHAIRLYYILPKSDDSDSRGKRYKEFMTSLPKEFETNEAYEVGKRLDIPKRTVRDWLSKSGNINRLKRGHYEKLQ